MLYHLGLFLQKYFIFFNIFYYTSFRIILVFFTSLFSSFLLGKQFIEKSKELFKSGKREYTPVNHQKKSNTPTMGGLFILANLILSIFLWNNLLDVKVWISLLCLISFALIGLIDDVNKIKKKKGISAFCKFILQITTALIIVLSMILFGNQTTNLYFPLFKDIYINLGLLFIPWAVFIIVGTSNAVNLTDGLDGLAIGSLIPNFITFSIVAFIAGHHKIAMYLNIPFVDTSELAVFGAALIGSSIGFLRYNIYPAKIFMGDIGSLSLGAFLALIALMTKQELLLIITGGIFVIETLSVMIQVTYYKIFKKRFFRMAPIHHHFELIGWHETKITKRFGIISMILCLIALMILKIK